MGGSPEALAFLALLGSGQLLLFSLMVGQMQRLTKLAERVEYHIEKMVDK